MVALLQLKLSHWSEKVKENVPVKNEWAMLREIETFSSSVIYNDGNRLHEVSTQIITWTNNS